MSKISKGLKSLFTIAKNAATGVDQRVSPEVAKARLDICKGCLKLIKLTGTCSSCGCFTAYKALYKQESCPEGHWKAEDT